MQANHSSLMTGFAMFAMTAAASAATSWTLTATNGTAVAANDFHAVFAWTGGTVHNIVLTDIPAGGGAAGPNDPVTPNGIDVVWTPTAVAPGQTIMLDFDVENNDIDLELASAWWTKDGVEILAAAPGPFVLARKDVPAPGALALLAGAGLLVSRRRR